MSKEYLSDQYIKLLNLQPHPEGGWYSEHFRSVDTVQTLRNNELVNRSAATSIYYLLDGKNFSAWHRLACDETWYYHVGTTPLIVQHINKMGQLKVISLGEPLQDGQSVFQATIPANEWFCASLQQSHEDDYALVSCAVSPGFEFSDFEMGDRDELLELFPVHRDKIIEFTRLVGIQV